MLTWFRPSRLVPLVLIAVFFQSCVFNSGADAESYTTNPAGVDTTVSVGDPASTGPVRDGVNRIRWDGNGAASYRVQRIQGPRGGLVTLATVPASARTSSGFVYDDRSVEAGTRYSYVVIPSNVPAPSDYTSVAVTQRPAPPALEVTTSRSTSTLRWTHSADTNAENRHCTSARCSYQVLLDGQPLGDPSYTTSRTVSRGASTHRYAVVACNPGGCSQDSNEVTVPRHRFKTRRG